MNQSTIKATSNAHLSLLSVDEFNGVYDVIMALVQQFDALQIVVIKPNVSLVIAYSYCPLAEIYSNKRNVIKVSLLRLSGNIFQKYALLAKIKGVHMLSCSHEQ